MSHIDLEMSLFSRLTWVRRCSKSYSSYVRDSLPVGYGLSAALVKVGADLIDHGL